MFQNELLEMVWKLDQLIYGMKNSKVWKVHIDLSTENGQI